MPNYFELTCIMTEKEIKNKMSDLLKQEPIDYDTMSLLSNELLKFDKNHIRFSVDAGVIDRLGNELVARQETAVSELVKNAYDADATKVTLTFADAEKTGGTLIIYDDGVGMNREELINGFMRISSNIKKENPYSDNYRRKRAGQKGIGRFAVQRLGTKLEILTQKRNSNLAYKITIDWNKYIKNKELYNVSNSIEELPSLSKVGTTLIISNLRDKWSEAAIRRVYRYIMDILQPFPLSRSITSNVTTSIDPGFQSFFNICANGETRSIVNDKLMIYDYATAVIDGDIDASGIGTYLIKSHILKIDYKGKIGLDVDDDYSFFTLLKNVHFKAYYFVYDSDSVPKTQRNAIQKLAAIAGGIRLYRNGFRVLPYGEPGDDWLSLDLSVRKRTLLPTHTNLNFFGFVQIDDTSGEFEETSSREGLMTNETFVQLQNFLYRTIASSVVKISEVRNVKISTSQRKNEKGIWEKIELRIKNIAFTLDELDKALEEQDYAGTFKYKRKKKISELKKNIEDIKNLQKQEQIKIFNEKSMLRVLSSVGLTIGQFIHEIKYYLDNINDEIKFLLVRLKNDLVAFERLNILDENFSLFRIYLSYFDTVISQNVNRELRPIELRSVVRPFVNSLKDDSKKSGIILEEPKYNGYNLYTRTMHPSEWSSILFNFYTNSKKAIKRVGNEGKIMIECGKENDLIYLEFSDTGDGISKENEERIFEEFYTTTNQKGLDDVDENNQIQGTGLGLKIVKDIVMSYRGNVMVVSPKGDYSTCIRVEIPAAKDKDLKI